jgi:hypothetical protein
MKTCDVYAAVCYTDLLSHISAAEYNRKVPKMIGVCMCVWLYTYTDCSKA